MMLQILKLLFDRLWAALACPGGVHYVSGAVCFGSFVFVLI